MYRLVKNLHYPSSKFLRIDTNFKKINTFLKVNNKGFFKKTNFLLKKDYYSKFVLKKKYWEYHRHQTQMRSRKPTSN